MATCYIVLVYQETFSADDYAMDLEPIDISKYLNTLINSIVVRKWDIFNHFKDSLTPDRRQSKTLILSKTVDKIVRNRVFDCHLSPDWRQMAIQNTVSCDL